jgi:hypothetical protein
MYPLYKATPYGRGFVYRVKGLHPFKPQNAAMPFAIIRVRNVHRSSLAAAQIHNQREYEQHELPIPENINTNEDYARNYGYNSFYCHNQIQDEKGDYTGDYEGSLNQILKEKNVKERSNSVVAIEYVMAISNEKDYWLNSNYSASGYLSNAIKFITNKHGSDNVISYAFHYDESNPHIHVLVAPIVEKEKRWKNSRGEGVKKEYTLCARDFTGGPDKLRQLQTDYHAFAASNLNHHGPEIVRGRKVDKNLKQYTQRTSAELGQIRTQVEKISQSMVEAEIALKQGKLTLEIYGRKLAEDQERLKNLEGAKQKIETKDFPEIQKLQKISEIQADRNKGEKWKKGLDFGM